MEELSLRETVELESTRPNDVLEGSEREVGTCEIIKNIYAALCPRVPGTELLKPLYFPSD